MMFKSDGSLSYRGFNASYEILGEKADIVLLTTFALLLDSLQNSANSSCSKENCQNASVHECQSLCERLIGNPHI